MDVVGSDAVHEWRRPALFLSTMAFIVCSVVWSIFGLIGVAIQEELRLSNFQLFLLVGLPVLSGSVARLLLGILTDRYGRRRVFAVVMFAAGVATFSLTRAETYSQFLVAAAFVGIAGGSFAVGTAYVSRFYGQGAQGTVLGIFAAGSVGSVVLRLRAVPIMMEYGWQTVGYICAFAIIATGVVFWAFSIDEPGWPKEGRKRRAPLKNIQVWRFSLYYFYAHGAFLALALYLPKYLFIIYKIDLVTAGQIGTLFSISAIFRVLGGYLSDRYGARGVMYWTFLAGMASTFVLAFSSIKTANGPAGFGLEIGLNSFMVAVFLLGFFITLGTAAVFKLIPTYYPDNVGAAGGLVSMFGGLGGAVLPVAFGALADKTGLWTSCFMLLFVLAAISLIWMHISIRRMERDAASGENKLSEIFS